MGTQERLLEQVLILRCQMGDQAAFAGIFERYHGPLLYYVRRLMGTDVHAEDVLQEVWLAVYRDIGKLLAPQAFSVWLYRIARNKAIQRLREREPANLVEEEAVAQPEDDGEDFLAERAEHIQAGLKELPRHHREVLVLRFLEQMSYEQIASVVGCTVGTIRSRLHHAKRKLRQEIERIQDE